MKTEFKSLKMLALTIGTCAAALCAPVSSAAAAPFTAEQKAEIEAMFKEFLAANPEAILQSVDNFRAEQEKKTQQSAQDNLQEYQEYFLNKDLPIAGNPDGDVTLVEFFDYNCGYCRKAFADIQTLLGEDKNLRVVFQEMPILSPSSRTMATLALAAHDQGKYFEMHKALMDYRGSQSDDAFYKLAESLGLDMAKMKAAVTSEEMQAEITKSMDMARALGIKGTPGFVVGDRIYPGYIGTDALRKAVADARAENKEK